MGVLIFFCLVLVLTWLRYIAQQKFPWRRGLILLIAKNLLYIMKRSKFKTFCETIADIFSPAERGRIYIIYILHIF